jgi:transposase-like protein
MARARDRAKEQHWLRLLEERGKSGLSVTEYCRQRRIPVSQFYWWQRQLRQHDRRARSSRSPEPAGFVPVRLAAPFPVVEVVHPGGCVIRIPMGCDRQALRSVLDALNPEEA